MLFDLTAISGQRVAQVDELHFGGRTWVSSTTVFIGMGGALAGGVLAMLLRAIASPGAWWPFLLIPICIIAAIILFGRKRSMEGETTVSRMRELTWRRKRMDGEFIRPGSLEPFDPNGFAIIEVHDHPISR